MEVANHLFVDIGHAIHFTLLVRGRPSVDARNLSRVLNVLKTLDADVVALQERH